MCQCADVRMADRGFYILTVSANVNEIDKNFGSIVSTILSDPNSHICTSAH